MKDNKKAIDFLYDKHKSAIRNIIIDFITECFRTDCGYSLKKLNRKLDSLVSSFEEFAKNNMPTTDSLGLRVRNILISDYKIFGSLISKELDKQELKLNELNQKLLVEASLRYCFRTEESTSYVNKCCP